MKAATCPGPFWQMLCAIALGIAFGVAQPELAVRMKPLGDAFVSVIRLLVVPIIFFTVAPGIAAIGSMRQSGRVGIKALICFELLSILALCTGLAVALLMKPGAGIRLDPARLASGPSPGPLQTLAEAFMHNPALQVLLLAMLCGIALALPGQRAAPWRAHCEQTGARLFRLVGLILKAAPLAAFGAIACTVGKHGLAAILPLLNLLGALYLASALFVLLVLGAVARLCRFELLRFIAYIRDELMIVIGTASSIAAMPMLMDKLERAGCARPVVGVVVPAGYSFNLNGSNVYIATALVFLAQAMHIALGPCDYLTVIVVALVTSKGASGVAGSAFIALAATLAAVPAIPAGSLLFIIGIERMLKCRSMTNLIGNGVACLAISAWDGTLDRDKLRACGLG